MEKNMEHEEGLGFLHLIGKLQNYCSVICNKTMGKYIL